MRLGYRPALDGLRAIAVVGVIAYHSYEKTFPGGYIAVEVFFVLSGFLITRLLIDEHRETGTIDLRAFYTRRARRLLPAVGVLAAVYLVAGMVAGVPNLWVSLGSMALYVSNWVTASGHPLSPGLGQMWSLAIEEQFYLVWPAVFLVLLRRGSHRIGPILAASTLLLFAWREVLWRTGATAERVYSGSDTRSSALLLGCLVAWVTVDGIPAWVRHFTVPATAVLVWLAVRPPVWHSVSPASTLTCTAVASAVLIASIVDRRSFGPVVVGQRAYGLYLWHPPMLVFAAAVLPAFPGRTAVGLVAMLVVVELSFRLVERPMIKAGRARQLSEADGPAGRPITTATALEPG